MQIIVLSPLAPHFASELWTAFVHNSSKKSTDFDWVTYARVNFKINNSIYFGLQEKSVLEQQWPQVDNDYHLDLICNVNNQENCNIKIRRSELDQFDEKKALELVQKEASFIKYHSMKKILNIAFDHYPGMDATLNLFVEQKKKGEIS